LGSYEPSIPFVAPGYSKRPALASCGEASTDGCRRIAMRALLEELDRKIRGGS
jgi:hypothetical protein